LSDIVYDIDMRPPRLARVVVTAFVAEPDREVLLGDLDEQFDATRRRFGGARAWRRYWSQVIRSVWHVRRVAARRRAAAGTVDTAGGSARSVDMGSFFRAVRLAARTAIASPGYSVVTVATLALAIGANTLLFSLASPLVVRPLPIQHADRLGWIWQTNGPSGVTQGASSMPDFLDVRARAKSFSTLGAWEQAAGTLTGHGDAQRVTLNRVTANFCDIWGLHSALGRLFLPGEDAPGRPAVGVLAYHYWQQAFGGDPGILGSTFTLDGRPITIVGVMEKAIEFGDLAAYDVWVPLPIEPTLPRDQRNLRMVGRLRAGVTLETADAEIRDLAARLAADHPATNLNWDARVVSTKQAIVGTNGLVVIGLLTVVVGFVLLIACANLANLVLARVVARRHEFAVRLALGASRLQVVRPLLLESLLLSLAGGAGGLAIAEGGLRAIRAVAGQTSPYWRQVGVDIYVLSFAVALALVTPLIFSLGPAMSAGRAGPAGTLRDARSSGGPKARWQRHLLVGSQVALALSLLVVSSLVVQTVERLQHVPIGMDLDRVLTFRVALPAGQYTDARAWDRFATGAIDELGALPGVEAAAVTSRMPVVDTETVRSLTGTLHDGTKDADRPWATFFAASPGMFRAAGITLLAGRAFDATDTASSEPVAVVSRTTADRYFDGVSAALGRTITVHGRDATDRAVRIVGVATDTRSADIVRISPQIWVPFDQEPVQTMTLVLRSESPGGQAAAARAVMRRLNPDVAISAPITLRKRIQDDFAEDNAVLTGLFSGFAMLALALAAAGLYGVLSYSVGQRRREIGVRLALGAAPKAIRRMVVVEALRVTGIGAAAGLVLGRLLAQGTASFLYGVTPNDPVTFAAALGVLLAVALVAVWIPARRAMRVDPVKTLRAD
jgi:putative ABC transport system permease protein